LIEGGDLMKIVNIELYKCSIDLIRPFTIALGTEDASQGVIIKIEDDQGHIGWGEASPSATITGDTIDTTIAAIDYLARALLGMDPRQIGRIIELMDELLLWNSAAKAAIDIALHDLVGHIWNEPLWRLLGGYQNKAVTGSRAIGLKDPERMVEEAEELAKEGYKSIKIKLGEDPSKDIKRVALIREAVGDNVRLRVDANQGWTPQQAIEILNEIAEFEVEFVEQPVKAWDIEGLAIVRQAVPIPIMADESIHQPTDAIELIRRNAVDYFNIKLMKSGGLYKASKIASIAEAANVGCMVGGMMETDLATTAAAHFTAATKNVIFGDLNADAHLKVKLIEEGGARMDETREYKLLPDAPGLGISKLNMELLQGPINTYRI
jgi:o-succinylbenzoate synthase